MFDKRDIVLFSNMPQHASKYTICCTNPFRKKVVNFWRQKKHSGFIYTSLDFQYTLREFLISALLLNRLNTQRASTQYGLNGCYIPNVCLVLRSWNPVCLTNDFPGNLLMKKVLLCNAKKMGKWGGGVVEKMLRRY